MAIVPLFARDPSPDHGPEAALLDDKAWQHLGITGQEFRRLWYQGAFLSDPRPAVQALDRLMRTGHWLVLDGGEPNAGPTRNSAKGSRSQIPPD